MSRNLKKYVTPLLAAAAATVAIAAAPTAFAADHQSCNGSSSGTVCQSPGNVKFKASPPHVQFHPTETRPGCSSTTEQVCGTRVPHPRRHLRRRGRGAVGREARG